MTVAFEEGEGRITVLGKDRAHVVLTPEGFSDSDFRNALTVAHDYWMNEGELPTIADMLREWPRIDLDTYARLAETPEFAEALHLRGVPWKSDNALDYQQRMVALKLGDPFDRRSTGIKLQELGVPYGTYRAWMRNPAFKKALTNASEQNLSDAVPVALNKLIANADSGDQRAIEKILEMTGRWNPSQKALEDAHAVMQTFMEIVLRKLAAYPDVKREILAEMEQETILQAVTRPRALEG